MLVPHIFCIARNRHASFLWQGNSYDSRGHSWATVAAAGDGAVGCFLFQAAGGKFSGGIFRRARTERRGDAIDRQGNESVGDNVHSSARCGDRTRARRAGAESSRCRKSCHLRDIPRWERLSRLRGESGAKEITLELNVGKVPVRFEETSRARPAFGEMTQIDPVFGMQHDREAVARATGLRVEDFDPSLPIETVSTGLAYTVTPLKSLAVIQKLRVDLNRAERVSGEDRREISLLRDARNRRSGGPFARPHAVLQRRRSGHGVGRGLHGRVDGGARRRATRRARADRAGHRDAAAEPDFCARAFSNPERPAITG